MSQADARPLPGTRLKGWSSGVILVSGVMIVPILLGLIFLSQDAPDAAAYVRMAFAQVAGCVVAIGTVWWLVVHRLVRRSPWLDTAWFAFLALLITSWEANILRIAGDDLPQRLA